MGLMKKKDKIITYDYGKYIGETNEKDLPHGDGLLVCLNGEQYRGEFKEGKYDGYGQLDDLSGREYVGNFSDGKFNGKGKFTWKDEDFLNCYEGDFKNGKFSGKGKLIKSDVIDEKNKNMVIERIGDFVDGQIVKGKKSVINKGRVEALYEGEFKNGYRDGPGELVYIDKTKQSGIFKNGNFIGEVIITFPDGTIQKQKAK